MSTAGASASAAPSPRDCAPYVFLGARGSGEPSPLNTVGRPDVGRYGVGGLGKALTPEYHKLIELLGDSGRKVVEARYLPYPAFDALSWKPTAFELFGLVARRNILVAGAGLVAKRGIRYYASVRQGIDRLADELQNLVRFCPRQTKIVLAGYSQGAHVVGNVLQRVGKRVRNRVLAVSLFGDPRFNPFASGAGDFQPSRHGVLGTRGTYPRDIGNRVRSWCYAGDWICQGIDDIRNILAVSKIHGSYGGSAAILEALRVYQLIRKNEAAKGAPVPEDPRPLSRPVDVSFVVDSTGSMFAAIDSVKENLQQIRDRLAESATSLRTALVDYKDEEVEDSEYQSRLVSPLTDDAAAFSSAVDGLDADGGGDYPESVFSGVVTGLAVDWRPAAAKFLLLIGDAPPKDPEPISGLTEGDVIGRALRVPAAIYGLTVEEDDSTREAFGRLAAGTSGRSYDVGDPSTVSDSILDAVDFHASVPTIELADPDPDAGASAETDPDAGVGEPLRFSVAASGSPVGEALTFGWDFGDGTVLSTRRGVVAHAWSAPFDGDVRITVTDESGRQAQALWPIRIDGDALPPPRGLPRPRARLKGRGVRLLWRGPRRGAADYYEVRADGRLVGVVGARAKRGAWQRLFVRGLRRPRRARFTVRAVDRLGRAVTSKPVRVKKAGAGR